MNPFAEIEKAFEKAGCRCGGPLKVIDGVMICKTCGPACSPKLDLQLADPDEELHAKLRVAGGEMGRRHAQRENEIFRRWVDKA